MKMTFKNLYTPISQDFCAWIAWIYETYEENIAFTLDVVDDMNNNLSVDTKNFEVSINEDYIGFTFKGHNNAYFSVYRHDFEKFIVE